MVLTHEQIDGTKWKSRNKSKVYTRNFVHDKASILGQWEKDGFFNKCFGTTQLPSGKTKLDLY